MRTRANEPWMQCYQVLHDAAIEGAGLTTSDLTARCNRRYGAHGKEYWGRQLQALADMGYAKKTGRWRNSTPIWVAVKPDDQQ